LMMGLGYAPPYSSRVVFCAAGGATTLRVSCLDLN
jgi:hypothetical protein